MFCRRVLSNGFQVRDWSCDIGQWPCSNRGGDCISFLKRKAEIKDTSFLLPGHGGLLDRADSILPVFILVPILVILFGLIEDPSLLFMGW